MFLEVRSEEEPEEDDEDPRRIQLITLLIGMMMKMMEDEDEKIEEDSHSRPTQYPLVHHMTARISIGMSHPYHFLLGKRLEITLPKPSEEFGYLTLSLDTTKKDCTDYRSGKALVFPERHEDRSIETQMAKFQSSNGPQTRFGTALMHQGRLVAIPSIWYVCSFAMQPCDLKKMAPKRKTTRLNPDATPTPVTNTHTTTSVTNAQIQAMINEGVTAALAARDATRNCE
ncbi:hypothetical protein Tco_0157671 [Tanacetum coccineum]